MKKIIIALLIFFILSPSVLGASYKYTPGGNYIAPLDINIRSQQRIDNNLIGHFKKGESVPVIKVLGNWCQVFYKKAKNAYVYCPLLKKLEKNPGTITDIENGMKRYMSPDKSFSIDFPSAWGQEMDSGEVFALHHSLVSSDSNISPFVYARGSFSSSPLDVLLSDKKDYQEKYPQYYGNFKLLDEGTFQGSHENIDNSYFVMYEGAISHDSYPDRPSQLYILVTLTSGKRYFKIGGWISVNDPDNLKQEMKNIINSFRAY